MLADFAGNYRLLAIYNCQTPILIKFPLPYLTVFKKNTSVLIGYKLSFPKFRKAFVTIANEPYEAKIQ